MRKQVFFITFYFEMLIDNKTFWNVSKKDFRNGRGYRKTQCNVYKTIETKSKCNSFDSHWVRKQRMINLWLSDQRRKWQWNIWIGYRGLGQWVVCNGQIGKVFTIRCGKICITLVCSLFGKTYAHCTLHIAHCTRL